MDYINLDDIIVKHLINFGYDTSSAIEYKPPHHLFKLEDSIHYKSLLSNDFIEYNRLIRTSKQKEHTELKFLELLEKFDKKSLEYKNKIKIIWNKDLGKYIVEDGCHRLSIIKFKKLDEKGSVPKEWFIIKN